MNKKRIFAAIFAALAIALIVFIFANSLKTAEVSSQQSGGIVSVFSEFFAKMGVSVETLTFIIRKLAHFTEYFLLGALVYFSAFCFGAKRPFIAALSVCLVTAIGDEFIAQRITEGRSPEIRDCIIDLCGGAVSSALLYLITRKRYSEM